MLDVTADERHRALQNLDILTLVFETIFRLGRLRSLAHLALTCMAWKELALDFLWRDVDVENLLELLGPITDDSDEASVSLLWRISSDLKRTTHAC